MKKLGIILDSFSGRTEEQVKANGWEFLPQSIILDGEMFRDGKDIVLERDYEKVYAANDVKTSMPAIGSVVETFERMSKEYENVIYLPMNKGMSSTYSTGAAAAQEFKNVHVIANRYCGTTIIDIAKRLEKLAEQGKSIEDIISYAKLQSDLTYTYVVPKEISGLIKSGRVHGVKKMILEKAKLVPLLYVSDDGFKVDGLKRNFQKTIKESWEKIIDQIGEKEIPNYNFEVIFVGDQESLDMALVAAKELGIEASYVWANCPVGAYSGKSAVAVNAWKK